MVNIYCYWEGERRHWFYDLCFDTIRKHNPDVQLLTRKDVEDVLGKLPPELDTCYITHKVDWIRKAWIHAVGGLWLDMDYIAWKDFSALAEFGKTVDFIGYKEWGGGWMDNFFAARAGSPIVETAANYALKQIRQYGPNLPWLAASTEALDFAFKEHPWKLWIQIPTHTVCPVSVTDADWFFAPDSTFDPFAYHTFGFFGSFHSFQKRLESFENADEFLKSRCRLSAIFKRALGLIEHAFDRIALESLEKIYTKYRNLSDKGTAHTYLPFYARILSSLRDKPITLVEIGVLQGGSLQMWRDYLHPESRIIGVDINSPLPLGNRIEQIQADATKPGNWLEQIGQCDVVIDDASHNVKDQIATWKLLWPQLRPGGIYVIEDVVDDVACEILLTVIPNSQEEDFRRLKNRGDDRIIWAIKS